MRTICTTHVCTVASGHAARIDSGRPRRPSQHTINASARPRFLSSVSIVAHCLAPSPPAGPSRRPSTSLSPAMFTPMATYTGRLATCEPRTLTTIASINSTGRTASRGRFCHAAMSATISSVIFEIVSRLTSVS